ncbi:MAG: DUF3592 domain-containing protein [Blastocatellales bacterium]
MRPRWLSRLINYFTGRDPVAEYLAWLASYGRVTEGRILDSQLDEAGETTVYYRYNIANVDYETSQKLRPEQMGNGQIYVPGASVTVRFDPRNPGSSIIP